jgi:uncharacterized protein
MPADTAPLCPMCRKPVRTSEFRPFCSRGCKDRDLLAWLGEGYRLPVTPVSGEDEREA